MRDGVEVLDAVIEAVLEVVGERDDVIDCVGVIEEVLVPDSVIDGVFEGV